MTNNYNLNVDMPRIDEMSGFLKYIYQLQKENPGVKITSNMIYHELKKYNVGPKDRTSDGRPKSVHHIFSIWEEKYKTWKTKGYVTDTPEFLFSFSNGYIDERQTIKIYIPIDFEHMENSIDLLTAYLENNNISHKSQVKPFIGSNNVVVSLNKDDYEGLYKIVNIDSLKVGYIREGLNKVNPFLPTINGIGVVLDAKVNYSEEIAKAIESYIEKAKDEQTPKVDTHSFKQHLDSLNGALKDEDNVKSIFESAITGKINFNEGYIKDKVIETAINATQKKYGLAQITSALTAAIHYNNYTFFTNGGRNYRTMLQQHVSPQELLDYVKAKSGLEIDQKHSTEDYIKRYTNSLLFNNFENKEIRDAFALTYNNHDKEQLHTGIFVYLKYGSPNRLSRYSTTNPGVNYREVIARYTPEQVTAYMIDYLAKQNYIYNQDRLKDPNELNIFIDTFVRIFVRDLINAQGSIKKDEETQAREGR